MDPGNTRHWSHSWGSLYTGLLILHCSCAAPAASPPGRLWRASAAQRNEVKDVLGSSGWLGRFLGSLAGVHLAPADPEVMAVVSQHLRADKAVRNQVGSPYLCCGFCPFPPVPSQPFGHKASRKRHFLCNGPDFSTALFVYSFAPLLSLTIGFRPGTRLCSCCADILLLSLYCKALASSLG